MFSVRSAYALAPPAFSRALTPCMPLVRCRRPTPHSASYTLLWTRQYARAFNQPLNFDTSSVTTMQQMFNVRSAHALAPQPSQPGPLPVHAAHELPLATRLLAYTSAPHRTRPSRPRSTPRPASYALLSTRQYASKFNQPLSFDTSSVITMRGMFYVRSAHAL